MRGTVSLSRPRAEWLGELGRLWDCLMASEVRILCLGNTS